MIASAVNPVLATIDKDRRAHPTDANVHRQIAARYEALADQVTKLPIGVRQLKDALTAYERLIRDAARSARSFGDALAARDLPHANGVRFAAARESKRETSVLIQFDAVCRTH